LAEQDCHLARVKVKGVKMPLGATKFPVLIENSAPESHILAPVLGLLVQETSKFVRKNVLVFALYPKNQFLTV
jgi:hypothetical protein